MAKTKRKTKAKRKAAVEGDSAPSVADRKPHKAHRLSPLKPTRKRLTTDVPTDMLEEVNDLVVYLQQQGDSHVSKQALVVGWIERGLRAEKRKLGVERVPKRSRSRLRPGRRITT